MKSRLAAALAATAALLIAPGPAYAEQPTAHAGEHVDAGAPIRVAGHGQLGTYTYDVVVAGEPATTAYCIDLTTKYRKGAPLLESTWGQAPGIAPYAAKVGWVLHHSYPYLPLGDVAPGIAFDQGLSTREAVAATQAAIWHYSNGIALKASDVVGTAGEKQDVVALYTYLTGPENVGTSEIPDAAVELHGSLDGGVAGQLVGPISVTTNTHTKLAVDGPANTQIVDAAGNPVSAVDASAEVYLDVPADTPPGSATITATADGTVPTGRIFTSARTDAESATQSLVLATTEPVSVSATTEVTWRAAPRLHTVAVDAADGDKLVTPGGTITDTVEYQGFTVGESYTIAGELIDVATGARVGAPVETPLTAEQPNGTIDVSLAIPSEASPGATLVVFERAYDATGTLVAEHADIASAPQTVTVQQPPAASTTTTPAAVTDSPPTAEAPAPVSTPAPAPVTTPVPSPSPSSSAPATSAAAAQLADTGTDATRWILIGGSLLLIGAGTTMLGKRAR